MPYVFTEEKLKDGIQCAYCGFNPDTYVYKEGELKNKITFMSLAYAEKIQCLACAIK